MLQFIVSHFVELWNILSKSILRNLMSPRQAIWNACLEEYANGYFWCKNIKKEPRQNNCSGSLLGGPDRIRTDDPHNANVMRSQLRYRPKRITRHIIITFPRPVKDIFTGKQGTPRDGRVAWAQKKEMLPPWSGWKLLLTKSPIHGKTNCGNSAFCQ